MSKRRTKRPSPGSQLGKPSSGGAIPSPFIVEPQGVIRNRRLRLRPKESAVDPVMQMPGMMGQPPKGRGFIPLSGGPKVKIGDRVGPPEDVIRKGTNTGKFRRPRTVDGDPNSPTIIPTVSPRKKGEGQLRPKQRVRGDYSNPLDFVKPSDFLTPTVGQPQKLPAPNEDFFSFPDEPYGPIDTRPRPKVDRREPDLDIVVVADPYPTKEEVGDDATGVGVYYFDKGRFLTRGKYNAKTSRTTQRRG